MSKVQLLLKISQMKGQNTNQSDIVNQKINVEWNKIQDQVKNKRQSFQRSVLFGSRSSSLQQYHIESIHKKIIEKDASPQLLRHALKCKQLEVECFKGKLMESLQFNAAYQENIKQITGSIEGLLLKMKSLFILDSAVKFPQLQTHESPSIQEVGLMLRTMQQCIYNAADRIKQNQKKVDPMIRQMNHQIKTLNNENENLLEYIDKRKLYSQNLKIIIKQLKQDLVTTKNSKEQHDKYFEQLEKAQINLDLKYRNRSELINIIKLLILQIKKHEKSCNAEKMQQDFGDLNQLGMKSVSAAGKIIKGPISTTMPKQKNIQSIQQSLRLSGPKAIVPKNT